MLHYITKIVHGQQTDFCATDHQEWLVFSALRMSVLLKFCMDPLLPKPWLLLQGFYADFARVADDESRHLSWCLQRLEELGFAYGDMVAHSILWEGAQASSGEL